MDSDFFDFRVKGGIQFFFKELLEQGKYGASLDGSYGSDFSF